MDPYREYDPFPSRPLPPPEPKPTAEKRWLRLPSPRDWMGYLANWQGLNDENVQLQEELARSAEHVAMLKVDISSKATQLHETNQRLSSLMTAASMQDRGSLSIAGTASQPDLIMHDLKQFRTKVENTVSGAATSLPSRERAAFKMNGAAVLCSLLFPYAASHFGIEGLAKPDFEAEVWERFRREMGLAESAEIRESVQDACRDGAAILSRIVLSTAPDQPGAVVFVPEGTPLEESHDAHPLGYCERGAVVAKTIFPGYRVGSVLHLRPTVFTVAESDRPDMRRR